MGRILRIKRIFLIEGRGSEGRASSFHIPFIQETKCWNSIQTNMESRMFRMKKDVTEKNP